MPKTSWRAWLADVLLGGGAGTIVGAVVAVNLVIYYGVDRGYETSLPEVFSQSIFLGVMVVGVLVAGPVLGVLTAHVQRIKRRRMGRHPHRRH